MTNAQWHALAPLNIGNFDRCAKEIGAVEISGGVPKYARRPPLSVREPLPSSAAELKTSVI